MLDLMHSAIGKWLQPPRGRRGGRKRSLALQVEQLEGRLNPAVTVLSAPALLSNPPVDVQAMSRQLPVTVPTPLGGAAAGTVTPLANPLGERKADPRIAWGNRVSDAFKQRVLQVADDLHLNASDLMAIMAFETGETFGPSKVNKLTGAVGLLQFLPATAARLGTTTQALARMSAVRQLDYVEKYFKLYGSELKAHHTLDDMYMAVFKPTAITLDNHAVLYRKGQLGYKQNAPLDFNHDGTITKAEASRPVKDALDEGLKSPNFG
jgi:hypothetical protein